MDSLLKLLRWVFTCAILSSGVKYTRFSIEERVPAGLSSKCGEWRFKTTERRWSVMAVISMKQLLEAGVHFGHQTRRWNPKMAPYIFTERNGIYIIDLQKTVKLVDVAYDFIRQVSAEGKDVLFVGTKKQAQEAIQEEATRANMHFVNNRWLGGMLTNFGTIKKRIGRMEEIRVMQEDGTFDVLPKKEVASLMHELEKLEKNLGGIQNLDVKNIGA